MRHRKAGKTLGRNSSHRKAMMRNMVTSFFDHEKITTTDARAKELRKLAERLITLGKRGTLHARRQALQVIQDDKVVAKLFERLAPRYQDRPGGYTRIIKLGLREGDKASMVIIELVEEEMTAKPKKPAKKKPASKKVEKKVEETPAAEAPVEEAAAEAPAGDE
jgi:large subunit ribosomal protein L17